MAAPTRRGRGDLALANITGTIVHFISFNAGVIALVKPLALDDASRHLHLPVAPAATWILCALFCLVPEGRDSGCGRGVALFYSAYIGVAILVS